MKSLQAISERSFVFCLLNSLRLVFLFDDNLFVCIYHLDTNGNWGQWRTIIACSVKCGTGSRTKERKCDSPAPTGNGLACSRVNGERVLQETLVEPCQAAACPCMYTLISL